MTVSPMPSGGREDSESISRCQVHSGGPVTLGPRPTTPPSSRFPQSHTWPCHSQLASRTPVVPDNPLPASRPIGGAIDTKSSPTASLDGGIMTTNRAAPVLCSLLLASSSALAQHVQVTSDNVAFLYKARAELPVPDAPACVRRASSEHCRRFQTRRPRRRSEFRTTESEEAVMAKAANMGLMRMPKKGKSTPAATGTPDAL